MEWNEKSVLVTGGASFIGSHLVDALVARGADVRAVDDLSSGRGENLADALINGGIEFVEANLLENGVAQAVTYDIDIVFHLAAAYGGRGFIELHQAECATNLALDGLVFRACHENGVDKVVFASTGCVYPTELQQDPDAEVRLVESMVAPPYSADNIYGWSKLMAELTLQAYHKEHGMKSAICRHFTAYGPRDHENHAIMAMIARSFIDQSPFLVWGDGRQIRNWTHVSDIVEGTIRAAEAIDDATPVNIGTMEPTQVIQAVDQVLEYTGKDLPIELQPDMPTGPLNRVADNSLVKSLTGWEPQVKFTDGLKTTIDWYYATHNPDEVREGLEQRLTGRAEAGSLLSGMNGTKDRCAA